MEYYQQEVEDIYKEFHTSEQGLSQSGFEELRKQYGTNELKKEEQEHWIKVLARQFQGMLIYILLGAALLSGILGEWIDTTVIAFILLVNGVIGFIQEQKANASIEALKHMASAKATVVRNGETLQLPAEELVPGDIIILETGDKVPADARVIQATLLEAQEGALTGESSPVRKKALTLTGRQAVGDQTNMVFSGTVITKGRGQAVVVGTGMKTEIGKIAHLVQGAKKESTRLEKELDKMGSRLGTLVLGICSIIFIILLFAQQNGFTLQAIVEALMLSVTLAVAAIPEGLPIVVTIALAIGTERMVHKNALIKRLASVETLGSTTVICSDKTGTLTKNEMTVVSIWHAGADISVSGTGYKPEGSIDGEIPQLFLETAALCNDSSLTEQSTIIGDPTEGCLVTLARKGGVDEKTLISQYPRIGEIPFSSERKRMTTVHDYQDVVIAHSKGAPDILLEHCTQILDNDTIRPLTQEDRERIIKANEAYAQKALRVLAFAFKEVERKEEYTEADEQGLVFVALTGIIDPPREEAKTAIEKCAQAGIRVVMITGDHLSTAQAIANELGITGRAIEGKDIENLDLKKHVQEIAVFARVNPEHKMAIVEALRHHGEIVAMTGDGVNDAPALKHADIGIAMGIAGTDVAKESAAMILTDDNFASIVSAVEEGRNIYTNIKKFVNYLLSSNVGEILTITLGILFIRHHGEIAIPLTATMILLMNLVTDGFPALALGVDPGDPKAMTRKPRDPTEPIINKNMLANIFLIGALIGVASIAVFWWALQTTGNLAHAQTMTLTTLVMLQFVRLAMVRQQYNTPFFSNKWLLGALVIVMTLQIAVIYWPVMHTIFGTTVISLVDWTVIIFTIGLSYIIGMSIGTLVQKATGQRD